MQGGNKSRDQRFHLKDGRAISNESGLGSSGRQSTVKIGVWREKIYPKPLYGGKTTLNDGNTTRVRCHSLFE